MSVNTNTTVNHGLLPVGQAGRQDEAQVPALPRDVLSYIFRFVSPRDLTDNVALASKQFKSISDESWYYRLKPEFRPDQENLAQSKSIYLNNPESRLTPATFMQTLLRVNLNWQARMAGLIDIDAPGYFGVPDIAQLDLARDTSEAVNVLRHNRYIPLNESTRFQMASWLPMDQILDGGNLALIQMLDKEWHTMLTNRQIIQTAFVEGEAFDYLVSQHPQVMNDLEAVETVVGMAEGQIRLLRGMASTDFIERSIRTMEEGIARVRSRISDEGQTSIEARPEQVSAETSRQAADIQAVFDEVAREALAQVEGMENVEAFQQLLGDVLNLDVIADLGGEG